PFSLDYTYAALDQAFSGAKFILTVRSTSAEWYESLTRFHTKIVGKDRLPTVEDLKSYPYHRVGWLWRCHELIYGASEETVYDRELYIKQYETHCAGVVEYFRYRPEDLLILNLSEASAMDRLCEFVGRPRNGLAMPHLNRSRDAA